MTAYKTDEQIIWDKVFIQFKPELNIIKTNYGETFIEFMSGGKKYKIEVKKVKPKIKKEVKNGYNI